MTSGTAAGVHPSSTSSASVRSSDGISTAVTRSLRRENSSLVRPRLNSRTSKLAPQAMTRSKIRDRICESTR